MKITQSFWKRLILTILGGFSIGGLFYLIPSDMVTHNVGRIWVGITLLYMMNIFLSLDEYFVKIEN